VARFYSNENIAAQVVSELRFLGCDVLTSLETGTANAGAHEGIAFCNLDPDFRTAKKIHAAATAALDMTNQLLRVNRQP
jgi:hypothetical protein